jgi:LmbE family N-acetylglucosaminyl deacetylase
MKRFVSLMMMSLIGVWSGSAQGQEQTPQTIKGPDERFKADILLVVAHPDDEGGATPYLARAIYDERKRVAVVFLTRGGSGGNDYTREHGPALADIREQEARQACASLGITNVWFLDGKDTASQNVLNSLANWGHGANLEALVRIVRLARPEVVITWLPGIFIGENHGDHQAAGVLATEAFDLAGELTAFPAQVAGASKRLEPYLENLTPWQPKKLYFFSDAEDQKQFAGTGPAYSIREISPSQKKPYWRLALDAAKPHLTQFPEDVARLSKMNDDELNKLMSDPKAGWWPEPMTLIFGKAAMPTKITGDVFEGVTGPFVETTNGGQPLGILSAATRSDGQLALGGPWRYYSGFRGSHGLDRLKIAETPELAIKAGTSFYVPLIVWHAGGKSNQMAIEVILPSGWKVTKGQGTFLLPDENRTDLFVEISTPEVSQNDMKNLAAQIVGVRASIAGKSIGEVKLRVQLRSSALPQ